MKHFLLYILSRLMIAKLWLARTWYRLSYDDTLPCDYEDLETRWLKEYYDEM